VSLRCFKPENHQNNVTEYVPAKKGNQSDLKQVVMEADNLLQLTFKSVRFLHHPLMSLEHFLVHCTNSRNSIESIRKLKQEKEESKPRR